DDGSIGQLRTVLIATAEPLVDLVVAGHSLVLTHGNGPQVGRLLLQQELASAQVPPLPMDVCGALSQGELGYLLAQAVDNALRSRGRTEKVLCLITQVLVDADDPAFQRPTKKAGARLVASPRPVALVEHEALLSLVESGHVVVAAGGGGIPVVEKDGRLSGVSAVIDKDRTAAVLAGIVGADLLVVLTDVDRVQLGFGTDSQRAVDRLTVGEARGLLAEGEFGEGTMAPKVEACAAFVEGGGRAAIGSLEQISDVIAGKAGTVFVRD
ncbi:MAG: carbamate kinase, partial [Frankiales bacterium]|nr:carbamate kinase [Frankiales bacterium]